MRSARRMPRPGPMKGTPSITVSIVSHNQGGLVEGLLGSIARCCQNDAIEIILSLNLPEELPDSVDGYFCPVKVIRNSSPKGFGANHNQAFREAQGRFFCVLNPDVRLSDDVFKPLIRVLGEDERIGLVAPKIVNLEDAVEDSARRFPTPLEIFGKTFGGRSSAYKDDEQPVSFPDWVAGMFMMFPRNVFEQIGGFDERYFLYYEDVDICARLRLAGYRVALCRDVSAVHDARRTSHRNLRYALLHLSSIFRFFLSPVYRQLRSRK